MGYLGGKLCVPYRRESPWSPPGLRMIPIPVMVSRRPPSPVHSPPIPSPVQSRAVSVVRPVRVCPSCRVWDGGGRLEPCRPSSPCRPSCRVRRVRPSRPVRPSVCRRVCGDAVPCSFPVAWVRLERSPCRRRAVPATVPGSWNPYAVRVSRRLCRVRTVVDIAPNFPPVPVPVVSVPLCVSFRVCRVVSCRAGREAGEWC